MSVRHCISSSSRWDRESQNGPMALITIWACSQKQISRHSLRARGLVKIKKKVEKNLWLTERDWENKKYTNSGKNACTKICREKNFEKMLKKVNSLPNMARVFTTTSPTNALKPKVFYQKPAKTYSFGSYLQQRFDEKYGIDDKAEKTFIGLPWKKLNKKRKIKVAIENFESSIQIVLFIAK